MPLVTAAVLAYTSGLLTGFGGAFVWTTSAAIAVVVLAAGKPRERIALAAIAVAGFAIANGSRESAERCRDRLLRDRAWSLTLDADAEPGSFTRAHHACGTLFGLAVNSGSGTAGSRVTITGIAAASREGVFIRDAAVKASRDAPPLARWRRAIGRGLDSHFGEDAPLVRALLIADMRDLPPALRDRFAAAGLSHMLSVSGLHVGIIAMAILLLAELLRVPRLRAELASVAVTSGYVALIGAPLPAVRAAAMLSVMALSRAIQRPTSAWAALAVGVGLPLVSPTAVLDLGYQLSAAGMVALVCSGALARRWTWSAAPGWRGEMARGLLTSCVATLLTAPLVASTFGRVSLVAPLTNLIAAPIMALLQPMLFLTALLLPVSWLAQFVADAARPLLVAFGALAAHAAALPHATMTVLADPTTMSLACAAAVALVIACVSRHGGRALLLAGGCVVIIAWRPLLPHARHMTEVHVIDVGQGDAIAVRSGLGRWILFDAGREWQGGDEGKRDVIPYIVARGGPLVAFVLSHPHSDHVGGAASTISAFRPGFYYDPGYAGPTGPYRLSLLAARSTGAHWQRVHPGDSLVVDDVAVSFLAPDSVWADTLRDPNLASTIAMVRVGNVRMLMTGDAEAPEERWLLAHYAGALHADVLKVAHHGSRTSSTPDFLDAVRPRLAVVSVGAGNMYGHPDADVMRSLAARGALTLRTDRQGTIVLRTDGERLEVEAGGDRWAMPPR